MTANRKLLEARILTGVMTAYAQQERIEALTFDGTCVARSRQCLEESYRLLRRVDRQLAKFAPPPENPSAGIAGADAPRSDCDP